MAVAPTVRVRSIRHPSLLHVARFCKTNGEGGVSSSPLAVDAGAETSGSAAGSIWATVDTEEGGGSSSTRLVFPGRGGVKAGCTDTPRPLPGVAKGRGDLGPTRNLGECRGPVGVTGVPVDETGAEVPDVSREYLVSPDSEPRGVLVALSRDTIEDVPSCGEPIPMGESVGSPTRGPGGGGKRSPYVGGCEVTEEEDDVSMFSSPADDTGRISSRAGTSQRTVAGDGGATVWR
jgi:hypothetical protein